MPHSLPKIAIIGRPNVGKSTLFNRILGHRRSVTTPIPGTTRDRVEAEADWRGKAFILVDTAGLEGEAEKKLEDDVAAQIQAATEQAELILYVFDMKGGITGKDADVVKTLRRASTPVILVANKADSAQLHREAHQEVAHLGLGDPCPVSATGGSGIGDLLDRIIESINPPEQKEQTEHTRIAIFGRPNVGKSTLLNKLVGEERSIVSDVSGTTRDSVDVTIETEQGPVTIIDTAGIRRKSKITRKSIDEWVTKDALNTLKKCDVALLLVDAAEPITSQDRRLAMRALDEGIGLILLVNKWDLVRKEAKEFDLDRDIAFKELQLSIKRSFPFLKYTPIMIMAAEDGRGVERVLPLVQRVATNRMRILAPEALVEILNTVRKKHGIPHNTKQKPMKLSLHQEEGIPPTFFVKTSRIKDVPPKPYLNLIVHEIRATADFEGTRIRIFSGA